MTEENNANETRGEWISFGILVVVLVVTMAVVAAVANSGVVTSTIMPIILGSGQPAPLVEPAPTTAVDPYPAPADESAPAEMAPVEEAPVTDAPAEEAPAVTDAPAPAAETPAYPAPETAAPNNNFTYTVKAGDTLYDIANTYGTTIEAIVDATPELSSPSDVLKAGMQITIPRP